MIISALPVHFRAGSFRAEIRDYPGTERFQEWRDADDEYVYRRSGQGEEIDKVFAVSLSEPAGEARSVQEHLDVLSNMLFSRLPEVIPELNLQHRGRPARLCRENARNDLVVESISRAGLESTGRLVGIRKILRTELEPRIVQTSEEKEIWLCLSFSRKTLLPPIEELISREFDLCGLEVATSLEPRRRKVLAVNKETLSVNAEGEDVIVVPFDECRLLGRVEVFSSLMIQALGERAFERYRAAEWACQADLLAGKKYLEFLKKVAHYFSQKQDVELVPGLHFDFKPLVSLPLGQNKTGRVLPQVQYCFSSDRSATHPFPSRGLADFGPYDQQTFDKKRPQILVAFPVNLQDVAERLMRSLRDGLRGPGANRLKSGFAGTFRLSGIKWALCKIPLGKQPLASRMKQALKEHFENNDAPDLALFVVPDTEPMRDSRAYLASKAYLLSQGVPSQAIREDRLRFYDKQFQYILENVAVAMYAKLGGTPWTVHPTQPLAREIVLGLGLAETGGYFEAQKRYVGITTVFSSDGNYLLAACAPRAKFDDYPQVLRQSVRSTLQRLREEQGWQPDDLVRVVFHSSKPLRNNDVAGVVEEAEAVLADDFCFEVAALTVSQHHPFKVVDPTAKAKHSFAKRMDGKRGMANVAECVPRRGTVIDLSGHERLLSVHGNVLAKREGEPLPEPLLIRLHRESTYRDIDALTRQVYHFAGLVWSSTLPVALPVTIFYSNKVARQLCRLDELPDWTDALIDTKLRRSRWFL